ncbi:methyltransferase-domain-containing protein [Crucibulum laeve]|uniref:Ribosomal RNA-processing protein 8 n=1 Tax=Crucibulum laeve TaxID=68775 RepID=A0A5C3MD55_9AGAR|nr:methyltransferase-domain-containing protein [Crucibulum laeve]
MPLFDVPGWSVPAAPVSNSQPHPSKKRKRPLADPTKVQNAEVNLEKVVKQLQASSTAEGALGQKTTTTAPSSRRKKKTPTARATHAGKKVATASRSNATQSTEAPSVKPSPQKVKKAKTKHAAPQDGGDDASKLTALQKGMKQALDGARFRLINETLYKSGSQEAHQMMKEDPQVYQEYHVGFRHQVHSWPTNPVEYYISILSSYPPKTVIADLGCGDAALARALIPKSMTVLSFDLVSDGCYVVEADTCGKLPLPGSEDNDSAKSIGSGHVVDVVVCALSLMGTNWPNCLREAWRILKPDAISGELKIAEVASRFTDVEEFQTLVGSIGFRIKSKDDSNSHFTLFEFKKVSRKGKSDKEWGNILTRGSILKPCEYKRR